jgi:hypothetical protein
MLDESNLLMKIFRMARYRFSGLGYKILINKIKPKIHFTPSKVDHFLIFTSNVLKMIIYHNRIFQIFRLSCL